MRLYNTEGAAQVDDPEYGTFKLGDTGAFDGLPDGMYAKLHGRPGWESEAERTARLAAEQMEKLRDPATMLAELQKMTAGQGALAQLLASALGVGHTPAPEASASDPAPTGDVAVTVAKGAQADEKAPVKAPRTSKKAVAAPPAS